MIAFFDSGAGGLTVLKEAIKQMPYEQYLYYGDSLNAPYGTRPKQEIKKLVFEAIEFLATKNLKALVLACNTATSVAVKSLRATYDFPIIGMEPAVKLATKKNSKKKILVCATDLTLKEEKLHQLIAHLNIKEQVESCSLQELVVLAENLEFHSFDVYTYLIDTFSKVNWEAFDSIVLGCTHFIYYKKIIRQIIPKKIEILDGNEGTVRHLGNRVSIVNDGVIKDIQYYVSGKRVYDDTFSKYLVL